MARGWIWPNFELIQALMYVIVTCKDQNSLEKVVTAFFPHYKSMVIFPDAQGQLTPQTVVKSRRISNSICFFIVTCKYEKNRMKNSRDKVATSFSPL